MMPETVPVLGAAATGIYNIVNNCIDAAQLDETARLLWRGFGGGQIDDTEAKFLSSCIEARRPVRRPAAVPLGNLRGRISVFSARRYQASPNREASRCRRRMLGGSSALPDAMRRHYTEGQRSVLCVIAGEVKRRGACELPIDKIGALAGVCRTTVQNTMRLARCLDHLRVQGRPRKGRKNLTNIITISSTEWMAWIRRAPSAARQTGFKISKILCPTKSTDKKERKKETCIRDGLSRRLDRDQFASVGAGKPYWQSVEYLRRRYPDISATSARFLEANRRRAAGERISR